MSDLMTEPLLDPEVDALGIIDEVVEALSPEKSRGIVDDARGDVIHVDGERIDLRTYHPDVQQQLRRRADARLPDNEPDEPDQYIDEYMKAYLVGNLRELRGYVAGMLEFLEGKRKATALGKEIEKIADDLHRGFVEVRREIDIPAIQRRQAKRKLDDA